jgi:hypothetical protein
MDRWPACDPPTPERVLACLDQAVLAPDQVIGIEPVRARPITAEKAAVNAVLAGGQPAHFPVVAAILEAMCRSEFLLHGATSSTGGCAVLVVVNGPVRLELGMEPTFDVLGNSDRASAYEELADKGQTLVQAERLLLG